MALRNACKDTTLDIVARLHLLEIIELRAMKWVLTDSVINYYKQKLSMVDCDDPDSLANNFKRPLNVNAPLFTPQGTMGNGGNILDQLLPHQNVSSLIPSGEIMMSSGKYSGPTQPHGKSYFKDEVYIRNADSGKGMGFNFFLGSWYIISQLFDRFHTQSILKKVFNVNMNKMLCMKNEGAWISMVLT